VGKKLNL